MRIQRCPKWIDHLRAEGSFLEDRAGNSKSHVGFQLTGVAQMKYDEVLLYSTQEKSAKVDSTEGDMMHRAILCLELPCGRSLRNAFYFSYYDARMLEDSTWGFGLNSGIAAIKEVKCRNTLT